MDDSADLIADFDAAATVAKMDADDLLTRLTNRLSGILVPPRTGDPREPGPPLREDTGVRSRRKRSRGAAGLW